MADRVALVTGGGSGIGAATVRALASDGVAVVVADANAAGAADVAGQVVASGGAAVDTCVDVRDRGELQRAVDLAVERFGGLHLAANCAGVSEEIRTLHEVPEEQWQRVIDINLSGVFRSMQVEVPAILASGGGAIVNVASVAGLIGFPSNPSYVASKHGVVGLTKSAGLEYARQGIRVNAVCPGTVDTPMLQHFTGNDAALRAMAGLSPMGRLASPDEIAALIVWLLSPAAAYMTGQAVAIDGGATAT